MTERNQWLKCRVRRARTIGLYSDFTPPSPPHKKN